jgi:hypothetical protein
MLAARSGHTETVRVLIDAKASVHATDCWKKTTFILAQMIIGEVPLPEASETARRRIRP